MSVYDSQGIVSCRLMTGVASPLRCSELGEGQRAPSPNQPLMESTIPAMSPSVRTCYSGNSFFFCSHHLRKRLAICLGERRCSNSQTIPAFAANRNRSLPPALLTPAGKESQMLKTFKILTPLAALGALAACQTDRSPSQDKTPSMAPE